MTASPPSVQLEQLSSLIDALPQMVWQLDETGRVESVNKRTERYSGRPAEQFLGRGFLDFLHPDDRADVEACWEGLFVSGGPFVLQFRLRCNQDRYYWFLFQGQPMRAHEGCPPARWVGTGTVIEAQKQAEQKLSGVLESMKDAFLTLDEEYRFVYVNRRAAALVGGTPEEFIGRNLFDCFPDVEGTFRPHYERARLEQQPVAFEEYYSPLGVWLEVRVYPFGSQLSLYIHDVTERVEARLAVERLNASLEARVQERTRQLESRTEQLIRSNRDLEQFAYIASHDLKEPLRSVTSYVQLLERHYAGRLDQRAERYIHFAVAGVSRMAELIEGLLTFSRVGRELALTHTDTQRVLDEVLENLSVMIRERCARVVSASLPPVHGDAALLRQVLQNLIGNAMKFQRPGVTPVVHVDWRVLGDEICFQVCDNGIGIDSAHFDRIFRLFQRLHSRDQYPGSGVGLAVVKSVVEEHGGRVWVESVPGEGSSFFFTLRPSVGAADCR